jgi:uncharacterized protein (DUF1778 family)
VALPKGERGGGEERKERIGGARKDDEEDKELQAAIKASELQVLTFVLEAAARAATVARTAVNPSAPALAV